MTVIKTEGEHGGQKPTAAREGAPKDRVRTRVGGPTVLRGVTYGMYTRLRNAPGNGHYRMAYYDGTLEIMSPELRHEDGAVGLAAIVRAVATVFDVPYKDTSQTTFRRGLPRQKKGAGKEPDRSFYFANEPAIRDNTKIDLDVDPPPDLWIEVDNWGSSRGRLPVYTALGVPEVWQYRARKRTLRFFRLVNGSYEAIERSDSLPMLTPDQALLALASARGISELAWDRWLRTEWAPSLEARP